MRDTGHFKTWIHLSHPKARKKERKKAASGRPVSLTSHIIKTLERVIRKRIVGYLEMNGLMDPDQHGSRNQRSCLSQLIEHYDKILQMMENGDNVDVIYTDFKKAYEKVDHMKLKDKINEFLRNRKQLVLLE